MMTGILYIVGTPIGNLDDISPRALRTLREVDLVASEDTRTLKKLLAAWGISKPAISYYDARERERSLQIIGRLSRGEKVALVSEAGMPVVSDPGYRLVSEAIRAGIPVVSVPGPSAITSALAVSGLPAARFVFEGFFPKRPAALRKRLFSLRDEERTIVFFESPRRLLRTLDEIHNILGEREVAVARELTKKFEEVLRGPVSEIVERLKKRRLRGEIVLVMRGRGEESSYRISAAEQVKRVEKELGITRMEAIKLVAQFRGVRKSDVYRECHRGR